MSDYKDAWNERYCELANELFDKEYWDCSADERKALNEKINAWSRDWMADRIDAARERAKYGN